MLQEISLPQHQPPADTQPQAETETATAPASKENFVNAWAKGQPRIPTDKEAKQNAQNEQQDAKDEL